MLLAINLVKPLNEARSGYRAPAISDCGGSAGTGSEAGEGRGRPLLWAGLGAGLHLYLFHFYIPFQMSIINYRYGGVCPAGGGTASEADALSSPLPFAAHVMELFWGPFLTALPSPGFASPQIWLLWVQGHAGGGKGQVQVPGLTLGRNRRIIPSVGHGTALHRPGAPAALGRSSCDGTRAASTANRHRARGWPRGGDRQGYLKLENPGLDSPGCAQEDERNPKRQERSRGRN